MTDKATPRPWHQSSEDARVILAGKDSKTIRLAMVFGSDSVPDISDEANAELIVHCVNHFDEVVAALERLVTTYDISRDIFWRRRELPRPNDDDTEPIKAARKALAAVKGQS